MTARPVSRSRGWPTGSRPVSSVAAACVVAAATVLGGGAAQAAATKDDRSNASELAYAHVGDVWIYDVPRDRPSRLTRDGRARIERDPRFGPRGAIAFVRDATLVAADRTGPTVTVARGGVLAHAWSPDGTTLAYVRQSSLGLHVVYAFRLDSKTTRLVKRLGAPRPGPGDAPARPVDDEVLVEWSPDGRALLVVDTLLERRSAAVHVLRPTGVPLVPAMSGTHAGWKDARHVYVRGLEAAVWSLVDVRTRSRSRLRVRSGRMHPSLSPDGRFLALDSGRAWVPGTRRSGCACTISIYDFRTARERIVARGVVAPVWLTSSRLAATAVRGCRGGECGVDVPMWVSRARALAIALPAGTTWKLALPTTIGADVRYG